MIEHPEAANEMKHVALYGRSLCYYYLRDFEKALVDYTEMLTVHRKICDVMRTYQNRADCYLELGRYELAMEDLEEMLRIDPQNEAAVFMQGQCYFEFGDWEKAKRNFELAKDRVSSRTS